MPIDGSGVASQPAATRAVSGQIIQSDKYNQVNDDIYSIINTLGGRITGVEALTTSAPVTLERFGGVYDGLTDCLAAFHEAVEYAYNNKTALVLVGGLSGHYRFSSTPKIRFPVKIYGLHKDVKCVVENGQREEGFHVLAPNVTMENFTISADADSGIINGTGDKGTCITLGEWFTDPALPEPTLVKNIIIRDMILAREPGSENGHCISAVGRVSGVLIENIDAIGAGPTAATGYHGNFLLAHWGAWTHGVSTFAINYDDQTAEFVAGRTITGATSGATAYIVKVEDSGTTGTLRLKNVSGTFIDNEIITGSASGGSATTNGVAFSSLVQARFEPNHYSHHPNNIKVRNCRLRNVGRMLGFSSSYAIDFDGIDIMGPVQGGQLVDLTVGDEAATFAHPDDYGRVYDSISIKNIRGYNMTGSGSGIEGIAVTSICTSKQSDADLAAYALSPYTTEAYAGVAHRRIRNVEFRNVVFDNIDLKHGPMTPPSVTPYIQTVYIRNFLGNIVFRNMFVQPTGLADDGNPPFALQVNSARGRILFDTCSFMGGVKIREVEGVHFRGGRIAHPIIGDSPANTYAVEIDGTRLLKTTTATARAVGDTTVELTTGVGVRMNIGDRIIYNDYVAYLSENAEVTDTILTVEPLPAAMAGGTSVLIDQFSRDVSFTDVDVSGGDEGFDIANGRNIRINGGKVRDTGQYGLIVADENSEVYVAGTEFSGNGRRRILEPAVATRDIICNGGVFYGENIRFVGSGLVSHNFVVGATAEKASLINSSFAGVPISGFTSFTAQTNGQTPTFKGNTNALGVPVTVQNDWLPTVAFAGNSVGVTYGSRVATYEVLADNLVRATFDVTLTNKGTSTGSVSIGGFPFAPASIPSSTVVGVINGVGLAGGALFMRLASGLFAVQQQTATSLSSINDTNVGNTTRFVGTVTYERA